MELLTKLEQKIANELSDGNVLALETIREIARRKKIMRITTLNKVIHQLTRKRVLVRIMNGKYLVLKAGANFDPYKIVPYLSKGAYISLESALLLYGYKSAMGRGIQVMGSGKSILSRRIEGYDYTIIPMGDLAFGATQFGGYAVATKAKSLFDCIYKIQYIGDFGALLNLIRDMKAGDYKEFLEYASLTNKSSFFERGGFLLESGGAEQRMLKHMHEMIRKPVVTKLKPGSGTGGKYYAEWHLYDNVGLERLLRW